MATVRDLLKTKKDQSIFSLSPEASVLDAMRLMAEHNIGAALVMQGGEVAGIVSERDIVRKVELQGRSGAHTLVREIMTGKVLYVETNQPVEEVMALMTEKRIRHLPVMENGKLAGVISVGDVLHNAIGERDFMIKQLEHYITGG